MKQKLTSFELARQTLLQLSKSKIPPTPENYHRAYDEIAGVVSTDDVSILSKSLDKVLLSLGNNNPTYKTAARKIETSVKNKDGVSLEKQLLHLISNEKSEVNSVNWSTILRYLLKQLDDKHAEMTATEKREGINRILINFANEPSQLGQRIQTLIASWGEGQPVNESRNDEIKFAENQISELQKSDNSVHSMPDFTIAENIQLRHVEVWRDLLIRTYKLAVLPHFADTPSAITRLELLIARVHENVTDEELIELSDALKSTLLRAEMLTDNQHRMQDSLIRMLRLLVASMGEMTIEDKWLHGQIMIVQETISNPINLDCIQYAENSLTELIQKQSTIRPSMLEVQLAIKSMMNTFVIGLSDITESTGIYHAKVGQYQNLISQTNDITQLNAILQSLVSDIGIMNEDAKKSEISFQDTQNKLGEAEKKINELTIRLDYINEVSQQDFLTGSLNRRGMDEAIEREFKRADRHGVPISVAIIDIDHFKNINDTMGHSVGDVALAHLAKVVKSVLRSTDVLARYGGEEFVVLLPGSKQNDAVNVVSGMQRALTKNLFLHNNGSVLITFSAGVAERMIGEDFDSVLPRADSALYQAKNSGRNRVVAASIPIK